MLSSDRIRKELAGVPAEQRCAAPWQAGIYTTAHTERAYSELLSRAGQRLAARTSGISDTDEEIARQMAALDAPGPKP